MSKINKNDKTKEWLVKAKEDLMAAETLLDAPDWKIDFLLISIGFHSQQCIEKCLKGYLIYIETDFKKSHDIKYLLSLVDKKSDSFDYLNEYAKLLNEFAVNGRYPDYSTQFSLEETTEVVKIARKTFELTNELIK